MTNPFSKLKEILLESEEIARLKQQFNELDSKTQSVVILAGSGVSIALMLGLLAFLFISNLGIKAQMADLNSSIQYLQSSSEKMEEIRQKIKMQSSHSDSIDVTETMPLAEVVEKVGGKSSIAKENMELSTEAGASYEFKLNKVSLRQIVRFFYYLENSKANTLVQNLQIESRNDPEGYLWSSIKLVREAPKAKK